MLEKFLSKVGIGSAKVDTIVKNSTITQGGLVEGFVRIEGGKVDQEINELCIYVMTKAKYDDAHINKVVEGFRVADAMTIEAGKKYEFPFHFMLPAETPITSIAKGKNQSSVWLGTELDIEAGLDSSDRDYLTILPHPAVEVMINKFLEKGFTFIKVDVETGYLNGSTFSSTSGIYQEIEMRPASSGLLNWSPRKITEVELSFIVASNAVHLLVEVDRSSYGDGYTSISYPLNVQENTIEQYFYQVFPR